jgi:hypothetical protein
MNPELTLVVCGNHRKIGRRDSHVAGHHASGASQCMQAATEISLVGFQRPGCDDAHDAFVIQDGAPRCGMNLGGGKRYRGHRLSPICACSWDRASTLRHASRSWHSDRSPNER